MPFDDFRKVLRRVREVWDPHRIMIVITGGEPLMRKDLEKCGRAIYDMEFPWGLVSNGLLMTPNSVTLLRNRAALFSEIDSIDQAYQDYSQILMIDDTDEDALYHRGLIELERGDTISSRADFERLLKINPASANGRIGFASLLKVMGYYPEAIEVYSQVIKFNPEKEILYVGRAEAYLFAGQYAKADKDIEKAMELDPDDPVVYVLRALGKLARYERESAKADLKRAVELGYDRESAEQLLRQEE